MSDATTPISEDSNLEELCRAAADGELDQESARRLNELVRTDESARKFYLDYLEVHALLAWRHGAVEPLELPLAPTPAATRQTSSRFGNVFVAATAVAVAAIGLLGLLAATGHAPWQTRQQQPLAIVLEGETLLQGADQLHAGRQRIDSGVARIELASGVLMAVEGPCEFELSAADRLHLIRGKLHLYSPLATRGFTVTTPRGVQIVDLGTRFGVHVDHQETVHVQLFEGRLRVNNQRELAAGEAIAVDAEGKIRDQALTEDTFPRLHAE